MESSLIFQQQTFFLFLNNRSCFHLDHEKLHSADDKRRVIEKKLRFANTIKNFGENLGSDPEMTRELYKFVEQLRDPPPCSNMKVWDFLRQKLEQNLQRIPVQFLEEGKDICSASLIPEGVVELSFASSIEERKELDIERLDLLQLAREISLIAYEIFSKIFPKDFVHWVCFSFSFSFLLFTILFNKTKTPGMGQKEGQCNLTINSILQTSFTSGHNINCPLQKTQKDIYSLCFPLF